MNQGNDPNASGNVPMKRKRGRPRKYPALDTVQTTPPQRNQNIGGMRNDRVQGNHNHGENASLPPGFETVNTNQSGQGNHVYVANDVMVGQVVTGVVEGVFDAGYLLTVKVGNSETTLRGVVFKPGHCIPISAENDIAPNVQMINRKDVPFPKVISAQVQGHNPQVREGNAKDAAPQRNGTAHPPKLSSDEVPRITNVDANPSISKPIPSMSQPDNLPKAGNFGVPTVSQSTNQPSQVGNESAHSTFMGKQVAASPNPLNQSVPTNQPAAQESGHNHESEANRANPLVSAPLQVVESSQSVSNPKPFEDNRTDKMTELLRVLQENFDERSRS